MPSHFTLLIVSCPLQLVQTIQSGVITSAMAPVSGVMALTIVMMDMMNLCATYVGICYVCPTATIVELVLLLHYT